MRPSLNIASTSQLNGVVWSVLFEGFFHVPYRFRPRKRKGQLQAGRSLCDDGLQLFWIACYFFFVEMVFACVVCIVAVGVVQLQRATACLAICDWQFIGLGWLVQSSDGLTGEPVCFTGFGDVCTSNSRSLPWSLEVFSEWFEQSLQGFSICTYCSVNYNCFIIELKIYLFDYVYLYAS